LVTTKWSGDRAWQIVKDIVLTGLGVWIIASQALSSRPPSDPLLVVAMALCAPAVYDHAKSVLSGPSSAREKHQAVDNAAEDLAQEEDDEVTPGPSSSSPSAP
jgi:hypothetical protein